MTSRHYRKRQVSVSANRCLASLLYRRCLKRSWLLATCRWCRLMTKRRLGILSNAVARAASTAVPKTSAACCAVCLCLPLKGSYTYQQNTHTLPLTDSGPSIVVTITVHRNRSSSASLLPLTYLLSLHCRIQVGSACRDSYNLCMLCSIKYHVNALKIYLTSIFVVVGKCVTHTCMIRYMYIPHVKSRGVPGIVC